MVLVYVPFEEAFLADYALETGEHLGFFEHVVVADPLAPGRDKEQEVGGVGGWDVRGLQVDAVDTADHSVVGEGHFIGDVDGFV